MRQTYARNSIKKSVLSIQNIDRAHQKIIKAKLLILAENPGAVKSNIRRLAGSEKDLYRLRVGDYRIIFKKEEKQLVILIIRIGHRKEIYWSLD
jgi:mRNA interferase RelE/StbE